MSGGFGTESLSETSHCLCHCLAHNAYRCTDWCTARLYPHTQRMDRIWLGPQGNVYRSKKQAILASKRAGAAGTAMQQQSTVQPAPSDVALHNESSTQCPTATAPPNAVAPPKAAHLNGGELLVCNLCDHYQEQRATRRQLGLPCIGTQLTALAEAQQHTAFNTPNNAGAVETLPGALRACQVCTFTNSMACTWCEMCGTRAQPLRVAKQRASKSDTLPSSPQTPPTKRTRKQPRASGKRQRDEPRIPLVADCCPICEFVWRHCVVISLQPNVGTRSAHRKLHAILHIAHCAFPHRLVVIGASKGVYNEIAIVRFAGTLVVATDETCQR